MSTEQPPSKKQRTESPPYELIYWPGIPGRGEPIRLCFEATSTPYTDVSNSTSAGAKSVLNLIDPKNLGDSTNPPPLCPPILKHGDLTISQLPNILLYLAPKLGLDGSGAGEREGGAGNKNAIYYVNALALTALDGLSNEVHDTHHPVSTSSYYESQKPEAQRKATDWIDKRMPKFISYFERVLQGPASKGGKYLYGGALTYADLVLFHTLDGISYAFPKAVQQNREYGEFPRVWELYERVGELEGVKSYLESERRLKYSQGIYRHYPELDLQDGQ